MADLWLVGAGPMAFEYSKVLDHQKVDYVVIGRGAASASEFKNKTGKDVIMGGLASFLSTEPLVVETAVVSVSVEELAETAITLIKYGVNKILLDKPGALSLDGFKEIQEHADSYKASIFIAYNRRFFDSVIMAKNVIERDGGVKSFTFDFTEWSHIIEGLDKHPADKDNWLMSNSSHVIDLAFYLGGKPSQMSAHVAGELSWHQRGAAFVGSGVSENGALFSYHANWGAPGRWGVELLTKNNKLILCPLEALQSVEIGKVVPEFLYQQPQGEMLKPGLKNMVEAWLSADYSSLCSLAEQIDAWTMMEKMVSGNKVERDAIHQKNSDTY